MAIEKFWISEDFLMSANNIIFSEMYALCTIVCSSQLYLTTFTKSLNTNFQEGFRVLGPFSDGLILTCPFGEDWSKILKIKIINKLCKHDEQCTKIMVTPIYIHSSHCKCSQFRVFGFLHLFDRVG